MQSIITNERYCHLCGSRLNVERHHIMFGTSDRKKSEEYGLTVMLCSEHHRGTFGVHGKYGSELNKQLKIEAQRAFEKHYSHEEWMNVFHKNYI